MAMNETDQQRQEAIEKKEKESRAIVAEQNVRLDHLQSNAFQLANFYFVFQGVILTVICNGGTALHCGNRWIPFSLSLFATTLNLVSILTIGLEYLETIELRDSILNTIDVKNRDLSNPESRNDVSDNWKKKKRIIAFVMCVFVFLCFSGVMFAACWKVTCHRVPESN